MSRKHFSLLLVLTVVVAVLVLLIPGKTGKDKTVLVDHLGAIRSMVAAQVHGARRYIMLSSIGADVNSTSRIAHYHKAKAHADNFLRESGLDYTVVCPGRLRDDPGTSSVSVNTM